MAVAPIYVKAPSVAPARFGLLDTIGVAGTDPHSGLGVQYEPEFCGTARAYDRPCEPEDPPTEKTADEGIDTVTSEPIPIYHLFECRLIGSADRATERAKTALQLGASRALEEGFQQVFGTSATDLTPASPLHPVDGLAFLEEYAGENYGGVPVIHVSRAQATQLIASYVVFRVGDHLETGLGSLVVAGAGYDPGASLPSAPDSGAGWMYATGTVSIWSATAEPIISPVTLDTDTTDNTFRSLAERIYTPAFECFHAAVQVNEVAV